MYKAIIAFIINDHNKMFRKIEQLKFPKKFRFLKKNFIN